MTLSVGSASTYELAVPLLPTRNRLNEADRDASISLDDLDCQVMAEEAEEALMR